MSNTTNGKLGYILPKNVLKLNRGSFTDWKEPEISPLLNKSRHLSTSEKWELNSEDRKEISLAARNEA
jgi:hypothetical protein